MKYYGKQQDNQKRKPLRKIPNKTVIDLECISERRSNNEEHELEIYKDLIFDKEHASSSLELESEFM
jgi:hypothetical protein